MKTTKRLAALLAVFALLFTMLSCAQNQSASGGKTEFEDNGDFYTIEWYYINPDVKQEDVLPIQEKLNEYLKEKINAEVRMNVFDWATYSQRINLMLQSREKMDLMWTKGSDYYTYCAKSAFLPISGLMEKHAPKLLSVIDPNLLEGSNARCLCGR